MSIQLILTPAAGKRLIAKAVVKRDDVQKALKEGKILVIGGTTNAYVANALLEEIGEKPVVSFPAFHRGVSVAPGVRMQQAEQLGDLLVDHGKAQFKDALPEICASMGNGDIIFKGANAVHLATKTAGILIGNTVTGGTIMEAARAVYSRRAKLILPVGLEKRVELPAAELQRICNDPSATGLRFTAAPGEPFTELDAIRLLTGCEAQIVGAGGVNGGEGCVWLQAEGPGTDALRELVKEVSAEPPVVC